MSCASRQAALVRAGASAAILFTSISATFAATSPFGIATPDGTGPAFTGPFGSFFAWVALRQSEFYSVLTGALDGMKDNGHAFWLLAGISFLYGVFHAVGPGHGKAVITSYLLVERQTVRRGVVISFAAALVQGLTAIAIVLVAALVLRVTAMSMTRTTDWFLILSYGLVAVVGAWLLWSKTFGGGHHHHVHAGAAPGADHHDHARDHVHGHTHGDHAHDHTEAAAHHHSHAPAPELLAHPLTLPRTWAAVLSVGIRPCSGAIIVLVFALSQQLLLAGMASVLAMSLGTAITVSLLAIIAVAAKDVAVRLAGRDSPAAERIVRVIEIGAAAFVMLMGLTLLGGALAGGVPGM